MGPKEAGSHSVYGNYTVISISSALFFKSSLISFSTIKTEHLIRPVSEKTFCLSDKMKTELFTTYHGPTYSGKYQISLKLITPTAWLLLSTTEEELTLPFHSPLSKLFKWAKPSLLLPNNQVILKGTPFCETLSPIAFKRNSWWSAENKRWTIRALVKKEIRNRDVWLQDSTFHEPQCSIHVLQIPASQLIGSNQESRIEIFRERRIRDLSFFHFDNEEIFIWRWVLKFYVCWTTSIFRIFSEKWTVAIEYRLVPTLHLHSIGFCHADIYLFTSLIPDVLAYSRGIGYSVWDSIKKQRIIYCPKESLEMLN